MQNLVRSSILIAVIILTACGGSGSSSGSVSDVAGSDGATDETTQNRKQYWSLNPLRRNKSFSMVVREHSKSQ